jgi:isoquinoline 1-oxidoreductase beta subunit
MDRMRTITVNGIQYRIDCAPDTPLLWVLRDILGLKGTKYGCGVGLCGICTVHLDGAPARACVTPVGDTAGGPILTIEGLAQDKRHPVLRAWIDEQVPQCGYCQPGMVMTAAALLADRPSPSDAEIDQVMSGVLCRCGTYQRVRKAIHRASSGVESAASLTVTSGGPPSDDIPLNPWVRIARDGTVTVVIDRSEMGQGVNTSLAALIAEELEIDLAKVRTAFAPAAPEYANPIFGEQATGGSTSMRGSWLALRRASATARARLIAAAAKTWRTKAKDCRTENGTVVNRGTCAHRPIARLRRARADCRKAAGGEEGSSQGPEDVPHSGDIPAPDRNSSPCCRCNRVRLRHRTSGHAVRRRAPQPGLRRDGRDV